MFWVIAFFDDIQFYDSQPNPNLGYENKTDNVNDSFHSNHDFGYESGNESESDDVNDL